MGKFGVVSDLLSDVSVAKTGRDMDTVWIPRERIRKNPRNGYEISNVQELAEDIARCGLAQPLEVTPAEDGNYLLITGERRLTALDELADKGIWTKDIPCFIRPMAYYDLPLPAQEKEMYAILRTNCLNRDKSDADLYFEVTEWGKIISELKREGYKQISTDSGNISLRGRTREIAAAQVHISTGQAAKIERIQKHGHERLQEAVRKGRIRLAAAYNVSLMTQEEQEAFLEQCAGKESIRQEDLESFRKNGEKEQQNFQEELVREFCVRNSRETQKMLECCRKEKDTREKAEAVRRTVSPYGSMYSSGRDYAWRFGNSAEGISLQMKNRHACMSYVRFVRILEKLYGLSGMQKDMESGGPETVPEEEKGTGAGQGRDIPSAPEMTEGMGRLPEMKNNTQRREWLRRYKEWGLWYRDPNINVNYYRYIFPDGTELVAAEYPCREHYWSDGACDEVFYHLLEKKTKNHMGKIFDGKFRQEITGETELVNFLRIRAGRSEK